jgi:hypothetical protein
MNPEQPKLNPEEMMREIDEFTETMHRRLKEIDEQEARYEKRRKPLPEKIYHVTSRENAQQIMREGLDPSKLYLEDREVVSLSDDIDFAIGVARVTCDTIPQNLVILEIDTQYLTPSRIHNYLRKAEPDNKDPMEAAAIHEIHYESTITPDAIKVIKYEPKK